VFVRQYSYVDCMFSCLVLINIVTIIIYVFEFHISFVTFKYEPSMYINLNGLDLVQFFVKAHQICFEFWGWKLEFNPVLNIIFRLMFTWPKYVPSREKRRNEKMIEEFSRAHKVHSWNLGRN
jgi:hypothetical protein